MTRSLTAILAAAAAILLAAGCAEPTEPSAPPPTGTPTLPGLTTPAPPGGPTLPPQLPVSPPQVPPTDRAGEATITGVVTAGVEPNCVLLQTEHGEFLLFGPASEQVQMGSTITLRGMPRPDMASTCQQGIPFEVTEVVD